MPEAATTGDHPPRPGATAVALAVIGAGALVLTDAATGLADPGYAQVGPGVFPAIFGAALLLAGGALLVQSRRGTWRVAWVEAGTSEAPAGRAAILNLALVAAALVLNVILFKPFGFIIASAVMFAGVSAAFGSRRLMRDAAVGFAFAAAILLVFAHGLGLSLPAGSLWESLAWTR